MKIALFGARGTLGSRIAAEAQRRGHTVTAVIRDPAAVPRGLVGVRGDVLDHGSVARAVAGHDAVISAIGPSASSPPTMLADAARSLIEGLRQAGVRRLVVVGGAGSLEVKPGLQLVDTSEFSAAWRPVALAHRDALDIYRQADLDWTYVSPAALIAPGERTGRYRVGFDQLLVDAHGRAASRRRTTRWRCSTNSSSGAPSAGASPSRTDVRGPEERKRVRTNHGG